MTNATPAAATVAKEATDSQNPAAALPDEPGQELLPVAHPEAVPEAGKPIRWDAQRFERTGDLWTLEGDVVAYYSGYTLHASKVVYNQASNTLTAEGPLRLEGGEEDIRLSAERGELNLTEHTGRFFQVKGTLGVRSAGRTSVYSTSNPFRFSGRELLQTGENSYRIVDGAMTNCRIPRPDWELLSKSIELNNQVASSAGTSFRFLGVPIFYLPYLRHPIDDYGRQSGILIPVISNSTTKGLVLGEQVYFVLNRSMDMVLGAEYYSHRGWAPNGDFRYKGRGDDHLTARWNALVDRGINETTTATATTPAHTSLVNQGGIDLVAQGHKNLTDHTWVSGLAEYLSSYSYRLVFSENFSQAVTSQVGSEVGFNHVTHGQVVSGSMERFQNFSSSTSGNEARLLHLPSVRYDLLDRMPDAAPFYFGLGASASLLQRSEPHFHARNLSRFDLYPHIWLPLQAGGWTLMPEFAVRDTFYSRSQTPDTTGANHWAPYIREKTLNRGDVEASVSLLAPTVMRDFTAEHWNRVLRHVISPEITYRYVNGIGSQPTSVIRIDTTDIATDTNEIGFRLAQRLYLKPIQAQPCPEGADAEEQAKCNPAPREWASWEISQKYYLNPTFNGALTTGQRNVFISTLDLSGVSFLNSRRNLSPVASRMRFEAIDNLRLEWDLDYDPKTGQMDSDNIFAGYSYGRTTVGVGHALLNAVNEHRGTASTIKSQILQPFLTIGKPSGGGFNLAANAGYDFVLNQLQYNGIQASYNWNCCGLSFGYRRFQLGTLRDETQYLYSFTIANFGSVGDIRRSNTVFRDPNSAPTY